MPRRIKQPRSRVRKLVISRADVNRPLCPSNKRSYGSEQAAELARADIYKKTKDVNRVYPCPKCQHFHLTTQVSDEERAAFLEKMKRKKKRSADAWRAPKTKKKGWCFPEFEAAMLAEERGLE